MKVAILTNSTLSSPSVLTIAAKHRVVGIGIASIGTNDEKLISEVIFSNKLPIHVFKKKSHEATMGEWLRECEADVVFVYTFNFIISPQCLAIPKFGFFNFHPGDLPAARGNPLFWDIAKRKSECTLTVHQMTAGVDEGDIYEKIGVPIDSEESFGSVLLLMAQASVGASLRLIKDLERTDGFPPLAEQDESEAKYFPNPTSKDTRIDWKNQKAMDVQALVNACNPYCGGAITSLSGNELRILEATPISIPSPEQKIRHGSIVPLVTDDLCIVCKDDTFICIDIVSNDNGFLSGKKWLRKMVLAQHLRF